MAHYAGAFRNKWLERLASDKLIGPIRELLRKGSVVNTDPGANVINLLLSVVYEFLY
jgi:hypothetical protein